MYMNCIIFGCLGFEVSHEYVSAWPEPTEGEIISQIKLVQCRLIEMAFNFFKEEFKTDRPISPEFLSR